MLCLSLLIVFVGNSSLNVTIPTLSRVLHATNSQLQWVIAIYSLVFAGLLFTSGAIGDRFGLARVIFVCLFVYAGNNLTAGQFPAVGTTLNITGDVSEFSGMTQISISEPPAVTK